MLVDLSSNQTDTNAPARAVRGPDRYPRPARLRILHVGKYYPPYRGGMESHLESLCTELKGIVDLKVLVANTERRTTKEQIDGVDVTRVGKLFDVSAAPVCPALVREMRKAKADIVHIHWPNPTAVLAYLASGHRGKLVFTYHSDIVRQRKMAVAFMPILRRALKQTAAIIVSSPNYIDGSDVLRDFKSRCRVIPFGVSVDHFKQYDLNEVRRIQERYGPRIVLGVGRMVYYKGFEHLVRAMALVDGHLLIIGDGPLREYLNRLAGDLRLRDRVTLLSQVEDIRPYYHAADVFALSSVMRSEAFGIVQLEAMACGKPVVNTQLDSGVTFVSPHGVSGLTVPPADSVALGQAIGQLLNQLERRNELGMGGRKRVANKFTVAAMVQSTFDLYQEVMHAQSVASSNDEDLVLAFSPRTAPR
jgi:glycosyltransferase involved in cell wall biosynthesis